MSELDWKKDLEALDAFEAKTGALYHAMGMLNVDAETIAPKKSVEGRSRTLAVLTELVYNHTTSAEATALISRLYGHREELDPVSRRRVELLSRDARRMQKIPKDEYIAYSVLLNEAQEVWYGAKADNDFARFAPYLEKVFSTCVRFAGYTDPGMDPYDSMLNDYEEGLNQKMLDGFFAELRKHIVPLLKKVMAKGNQGKALPEAKYPIWKQREFSSFLMDAVGVDRDRCVIGETEHPFTEGFHTGDVRVTTHYFEGDLLSNIYSVIHECGHAIYELDDDPAYDFTCLSGGASTSMHESQSRFYENIIGRSHEFISYLYPTMQKMFPEQLAGVEAETFYAAANRAEPSLIRTEADELTYSLHIMVRYELEKQLVKGTLKVEDIPAAWNRLYKEYLGIDVPDDKSGCLQDVHWSAGLIGYFPSYALGSAFGAQMLALMEREYPSLHEHFKAGDISEAREWLKEKIHRHGKLYPSTTLFEMVCGKFDPTYYTRYLEQKFTALYGLDA